MGLLLARSEYARRLSLPTWPTGRGSAVLALVLSCLLVAAPALAQAAENIYKIGVLAIRGKEQCLKSWSATADYLSHTVEGASFTIVPLGHGEINSAVADGQVDFILTNSSSYVELEYLYGANRIATLKERRLGRVYSQYGSVIFSRRDRQDIRHLSDLKDKRFMAVSENSLGGWQMAWLELKENGIDPYQDFKELTFSETHDAVVAAVQSGFADAGTVRTNTLEQLSAEGRIQLNDFYVFPRLEGEDKDTPYLCTTREYPDWPMAKAKATPDRLAEQVTIALLLMDEHSPAAKAAGCAGWTIPLNYQPVHDLLRTLHLGPYIHLDVITWQDVLRAYAPQIGLLSLVFTMLASFTALILKLNRRIKASHLRLVEEIKEHRKLDEELKTAKDLAEAATSAKSEFLANMSHEIRTPMNGIIAATDLALSEKVAPAVEQYLHIIQNSSYALLGIINDILDFSKIEAGQLELKERVFRLDEMFDRVMDVFIHQAGEKGIELMVDIDPATPRILLGDSLRLQQILTNLISNSIKFTPAGGTIMVSTEGRPSPPELGNSDQFELAFAVKDSGAGISAEYLPRLFQPFTQGDSTSTRKYEGTGLGLSICKRFVTLMGGDIRVESTLGLGSTFFFTVRLRQAGSLLPGRHIFPPDIQGLRALVVDDLLDSRIIISKILTSLGFKVEVLSSGIETLERLQPERVKEEPVDLIMMDWKMPVLDGIETSRKIRQELHLTMPIIMMTAFSKDVQRAEAEGVGTNGFLSKPIFQSTLFDAIMDAFGKEGNQHNLNASPDFTTRASMYQKRLKGCRLLLVEDNLTNQQVARAILEKAGIEVTIAANGEEAVQAISAGRFEVVLMDIQMPVMNGYEATRRIRMLPEGSHLPIIAMTAHAMKGDEEKCLEAGMDGYIAKPINQDRMFQTLWRFLRNTRANDEQDQQGQAEDHSPATTTQPTSGREDEDQLATQLPRLDVHGTLATLGIDCHTLVKILIGFYQDNNDTEIRIRHALRDQKQESLLHISHSLKGSAGNIGAHALKEKAGAVELACQEQQLENSRALFAELTDSLIGELILVRQSLQGLATAVKSPELPGPVVKSTNPVALLGRLAEAIEHADPEAIGSVLAELQQASGQLATESRADLDLLSQQIDRYDYDQALITLAQLRHAQEAKA